MQVRKARPEELDEIFKMGFDVWSNDLPLSLYLEVCRNSLKYQQGQWYVLENENDELCSSLITYSLAPHEVGIGSIATLPDLRGRGYSSKLIREVLTIFESPNVKAIYLYSDIGTTFYKKFGFVPLPEKFQTHALSICMVRGFKMSTLLADSAFVAPKYF